MQIIDFLFNDAQLLTTAILFVLIALLVGSFVSDKLRKYRVIDSNNAISLMDDKTLTILDVREGKERKNGYIANDTHMPLATVKSKLDTLDKRNNILVYCHSGARSAHIARLLSSHKFAKVHSLKGGFQAWKKANLPIKK